MLHYFDFGYIYNATINRSINVDFIETVLNVHARLISDGSHYARGVPLEIIFMNITYL